MRVSHATAAMVLAMFAAPEALACKGIVPPPPPQVFWREAPTPFQLLPGEVALRVAFSRFARSEDPEVREFAAGDIVIIGCNVPRNQVYMIVEVLGGDDPDRGPVMISGGYTYDTEGADRILVGQIVPLRPEKKAAYQLELGHAWRLLTPRLPVGAEAAPITGSPPVSLVPTFPTREIRLN